MARWVFDDRNTLVGPLTEEELIREIRLGHVSRYARVRTAETEEWTAVGRHQAFARHVEFAESAISSGYDLDPPDRTGQIVGSLIFGPIGWIIAACNAGIADAAKRGSKRDYDRAVKLRTWILLATVPFGVVIAVILMLI